MKKIITRIHFYLLGLIILNFISKLIFDFTLNLNIVFIIKVLIILTGIILFFWNIKPFKIIEIYFSYYVLSPIILIFAWFTDGIMGGIIASLFLYPVQTDFPEYQNENFKIYEKHKGFLDGCCTYLITEKQLMIFEKKVKEIDIEQKLDFEKSKLSNENGVLRLKYQYDEYDYKLERRVKVDSTIVIRPKKLL